MPFTPALIQGTRSHTFNRADQIEGFSYDKLGRLTGDGARTYQWDLAGRLASYTEGPVTVSFTHDAFGSLLTRAQSGQTRRLTWNYALGVPSVSILKDGDTVTRFYIHTPTGALLYSVEPADNARRFYHFDEMGSTLFLTDDRGQITDSYAYLPYGKPAGLTGTTDNPFTYVGQWGVMWEPATDLYYMRARYYDSATGRFLSRDPLGEDLTEVRSLDLYHYAAQNPLRFVDPRGLDFHDRRSRPRPMSDQELRERNLRSPGNFPKPGLAYYAETEEERAQAILTNNFFYEMNPAAQGFAVFFGPLIGTPPEWVEEEEAKERGRRQDREFRRYQEREERNAIFNGVAPRGPAGPIGPTQPSFSIPAGDFTEDDFLRAGFGEPTTPIPGSDDFTIEDFLRDTGIRLHPQVGGFGDWTTPETNRGADKP